MSGPLLRVIWPQYNHSESLVGILTVSQRWRTPQCGGGGSYGHPSKMDGLTAFDNIWIVLDVKVQTCCSDSF